MGVIRDCDQLLVQRAQCGDRYAFDLLVLRYERRILRLIARLVPGRMEAEDVAQDTFLRAYRSLHNFRGDAKFYTWLYRIAVNSAKDFLRRKAERESPFGDVDIYDSPGSTAFEVLDMNTPDCILMSKQIAAAIYEALNALPVDIRAAILLREMEGMSYKEISAALGCPVGTVRSRIYRAREFISGRLVAVSDCGLPRELPRNVSAGAALSAA